ncbi:LysR family transcriptional regulator [Streptomyces sp. NPDC086033]|uniref:LysR family transcriptional regulator n=1 Tax=Streptomyces sp. NPDC086033 TaxID=3365747 RepID=UPI0037D4BD62
MDLRNIRYFLAVADAGSITEAAKALHLSQPPLSTAMAKLESELGVPLLNRLPRGVTLTPAGRYLQAAGRRLIAEEQRLSATLRAMGEGLEGELRVGAEPMGLWRVVSTRVASFLSAHPRVSLELMDAPPRVQLENLANGYLDLAVIPVLPQEPLQPIGDVAFTVDVVATLPLTLIAPQSWNLGASEPLSLAGLRDQTWILPRRLPGARSLSRLIDDRFTSVGGSPTKIIPVPTVQTAVTLVAAGLGVSVMSDEMAAHHPGVDRVPVAGGWPELPLGLVRRQDGIVTPVAGRFAGLFGVDETGESAD